MRILCSVCGIDGLVQRRGNSIRIQHYVGFKDGRRVYNYHKMEVKNLELGLDGKFLEVNGHKTVEVKNPNLGSNLKIERGMWDLNPRGLSTTDLAGLPHTRLGQSRTLI